MTDHGSDCAAILVLKAHRATIQVTDEFVRVKRTWRSKLGGTPDAVVWLNDIRGVFAVPPTRRTPGWVYLCTISGPDAAVVLAPDRRHQLDRNSHAMLFGYAQQDEQRDFLAQLRVLRGASESWV